MIHVKSNGEAFHRKDAITHSHVQTIHLLADYNVQQNHTKLQTQTGFHCQQNHFETRPRFKSENAFWNNTEEWAWESHAHANLLSQDSTNVMFHIIHNTLPWPNQPDCMCRLWERWAGLNASIQTLQWCMEPVICHHWMIEFCSGFKCTTVLQYCREIATFKCRCEWWRWWCVSTFSEFWQKRGLG